MIDRHTYVGKLPNGDAVSHACDGTDCRLREQLARLEGTAMTRDDSLRDLDACERCGAHRWRPVVIDGMPRPDTYRCDECNDVYEVHERVSLGRD